MSNASSQTTVSAAARTTQSWLRAGASVNNVSNVGLHKTSITPQPTWPRKRQLSDDISTTTGCSDAEDTASTLSRSSSVCELACVVSRDAMLFHRARCLPKTTDVDRPRDLHCRLMVSSLPGPTAKAPPPAPAGFVPPPGLELLNGAGFCMPSYSPHAFRKELMAILKDLAMDRNVARGVRRVRAQGVPCERHAAEFADAITFVLEEPRGAARRSFVALLAGLANGVFERKQCIAGLGIFFDSVYPDLQAEVPKLNKLVCMELLPTLSSVFAAEELSPFAAKAKA